MSKAPPIPPEQRASRRQKPDISSDHRGPAGNEVNLREQGQSGNLRQNTTHARNVQDR
jgi:hypothetical protein